MKFEFDTRTDTAKDAAALAAALAVLHGPAVAEALEEASDRIDSRAVDGMPHPDKTAFFENRAADLEKRMNAEAVDTSAADAFGGIPAQPTEYVPGTEGPTLDKAGIPWDERIHASTKTTNKDGTWTRRRNTDDALFDKVMAELKGGAAGEPAGTATAAAGSTETQASAPAVVVPPPPPSMTETTGSTADAASTAETVVPPPPPSTDPITFPKLMVKITKAQTAQTIDAAKVVEFLGMFGLSAVKELASAPAETIQAVNDLVDAHVGA